MKCLQAHVMLFIQRLRIAFARGSIRTQTDPEFVSAFIPATKLDTEIIGWLERNVQLYFTEFRGIRTLCPQLPHFLALAVLVLKELQRSPDSDSQKIQSLADGISATLATVQDPQLESGWARILQAAVEKVRDHEADALVTDVPTEWPLDVLDGYMNVFSTDN